jgi:hypothetical protein
MREVTRILSAIEQGDPHAAEQLLPLVYDELRRRAAPEQPGTALVREAPSPPTGGQRRSLRAGTSSGPPPTEKIFAVAIRRNYHT